MPKVRLAEGLELNTDADTDADPVLKLLLAELEARDLCWALWDLCRPCLMIGTGRGFGSAADADAYRGARVELLESPINEELFEPKSDGGVASPPVPISGPIGGTTSRPSSTLTDSSTYRLSEGKGAAAAVVVMPLSTP
jgi:hypothetical protein